MRKEKTIRIFFVRLSNCKLFYLFYLCVLCTNTKNKTQYSGICCSNFVIISVQLVKMYGGYSLQILVRKLLPLSLLPLYVHAAWNLYYAITYDILYMYIKFGERIVVAYLSQKLFFSFIFAAYSYRI